MTIQEIYQLYQPSAGVSTDTRNIQKGQLFFALKGDNFNGNKFASQAIESGAAYAIIDEADYKSERCILVDNALACLQNLARYHRQQLSIPFIGLTGSNGKTTSKELVAAALSKGFKVGFTQGNLNNHIGVPLSILNLPVDAQIAIIEMGANAQKEIEFLSSISLPDIGFITNYGKAHLEGFGGPEGFVKGKSELFDNLRKHNKMAWVNIEDSIQIEKSKGITQKTFGPREIADFPVYPIESKDAFVRVKFQDTEIHSHLTGHYNFSNLAIAISLASHFGLSAETIKAGIESYQPTNNRSQLEAGIKNLLLKDYYNANPSSMDAALTNFKSLREKSQEDKWVILGDMFEMGDYEAEEHQKICNMALSQNYGKCILVGQAFSATEGDALKFETTLELISWLRAEKPENKLILIKGSRGMRLEGAAEIL